MMYLVTAPDKKTGEAVPLGIFDSKEKIKRALDGIDNYTVLEYKVVNKLDYESLNLVLYK